MAEREYQRLTRTGARTAFGVVTVGRSSLWLGKDHVLVIDTNGYTETYKRFFFRDIQALTIRRSSRRMIVNLILGVLAALFASFMAMALSAREVELAWAMGGVTALWLLIMLVQWLKGPTCVCHIRTAVQTEELPSLTRVRKAHKVLARIRPLVAEAQGVLAPEEVPARLQEWMASNTPVTVAPPTATAFVVDDPNAPPRIVS